MEIRDKTGKVLIAHSGSHRDFSDLDLRNADFTGWELEGCCFDSADLRGADFTGSNLYWANLMDANCDDCSFVRADMRGALLLRASFHNADMTGASLTLDNLLGSTDVSGIDLSQAILDDADFSGATYDADTKFPTGFDPEMKGLHFKS